MHDSMPRTDKSIDKYIKGYIELKDGRLEGLGVMAKACGVSLGVMKMF